MNRQRLLDRFLQYVKIDSMAVDEAGRYPSSDGQLEMGRLVVQQLHDMGIGNAEQDEHGLVYATIPGTVDHDAPTVAFNAHFDTSPETTADNVQPQIIDNYPGGDISLGGDTSKVITVEKCPALAELIGKTLITTDGTTLLGGDDKAGVSIMMELANHLMENRDIEHGSIRLLFTCDEEIGHGVDHVDIEKVGASACYTFDGGEADIIDNETFSADGAQVTVTGVNIHPAIAKDKMINALRAAAEFVSRLPRELSPECTDGRDGFVHPYVINGGVTEVTIKLILRSFNTSELVSHAELLEKTAREVEREFPGIDIGVDVKKQYRNMAEGLGVEPRAVEFAVQAHKNLGRAPKLSIIRGGTDGSQLTERGLPTPNLSSGQHNIHSPLEFACLDQMVAAAEVGLEIVKIWGKES